MADEVKDAEVNPLSDLLTPQALYMMRLQMMQQQMGQAAQLNGRNYAARMAGMGIGQALNTLGGQGNGPLDRLAQNNMQALDPNGPLGLSASGGDAAGSQDPAAPLEAQAQMWDARAKYFNGTGQVVAGQNMTAYADRLRKQAEDLRKTVNEAYQARKKGDVEGADMNDIKPVFDPKTNSYSYAAVPKLGGAAIPITGVNAPPPTPVSTIDLRGALPGFDKTLSLMEGYKKSADQAVVGLGNVQQMEDLLSNGKVITGSGADARVGFNNFLGTIGFQQSKDATANTAAYLSLAKQQAMNLRPASMQRLTNADLAFLNQLSAGNIEWNADALKRVVAIQRRTFQAAIDTYHNQKQSAIAATYTKGLDPNVATSMRAGINSMGEPGAVPAPQSPVAPQSKTVTQEQIADYAQKHGLTVQQATDHAKANGITVQP